MTDLITLPRAVAQQALHVATAAGYPVALITALKAALEQPVQEPAKRATGWVAPKDHYTTPVFFNPYTGDPRDVRDVRSDPQGILIVPPGAAWLTAKG
jgi:hypothetical protein